MASTIITKNSITASAVPVSGDLTRGELALNLTDGRIYSKDEGTTIVELGINPSTIAITAGTIDNTVIGATTAVAGTFTNLTATGTLTGTLATDAQPNITSLGTIASLVATTADINGGTIDGTVIGGTTPAAISGTTGQFGTSLNVDGTATMDGLTVDVGVANQVATFSSTDAGAFLYIQDNNALGYYHGSSGGSYVIRDTDNKNRINIGSDGDISFYEDTGTTAKLFWDASAESLGIGTSSPSSYNTAGDNLVIAETTGGAGVTLASSATGSGHILFADGVSGTGAYDGFIRFDHTTSSMRFATGGGTERMRIDSSGNVGIGTSTPGAPLHISKAATGVNAATTVLKLSSVDTSTAQYVGFQTQRDNSAGQGLNILVTDVAGTVSEAMRIDSSGNVLVGKSSADNTTAGTTIYGAGAPGAASFVRDAGNTLVLNRLTSDGEIVAFRKDGTAVGSISCGNSGSYIYFGSSAESVGLGYGGGFVFPTTGGTTGSDNSKDLGSPSYRFKDIYATNGTIQTSDAREKTAVRELTDAEMRVAKKLSKNIGFFQWLSAVEEKGEDARSHCGQTVQGVIAEFEAEGLDAFDYAMVCYNSWEAESIDHPAIEAVEAVVAVEGVEAVEAVEAVDAWTEQTQEQGDRFSLRTDQLNHFMIRGLSQNQTELEARLSALEA